MKKNTLRFRKKIFKTTKKPIEYVHVNNPKTKQDYRQVHFNNWCKANKVFCGSYLPYNPKALEKKGSGWKAEVSYDNGTKTFYTRNSTSQRIRYDLEKDPDKISHYHWLRKKEYASDKYIYYDRSKGKCKKKTDESHILPYDVKYERKKIKDILSRRKHYN